MVSWKYLSNKCAIEMKRRHQLDFYGYRESNGFVPRYYSCCVAPGVTLTLSKEDGNIITIAKDGGIKASLGLEADGFMLYLVNLETGARIGGVEAPGANAITDFSMNGTNDILTVCVKRADGSLENKVLNLGNVIRAYTAGNGIDISDKAISVRLAENGGLEIRDGGLAVNDDEIATQPELDAVISSLGSLSDVVNRMQEDISGKAPISAITSINERIDNLDLSEYSGGAGVLIEGKVVSIKAGSGLSYDENGMLYVSKSFDDVDVDTELDENSTNPVENRAIASRINEVERVSAEALNDLNDRVDENASNIAAISASTPTVDYPSAGDGLVYDQGANEYYVNIGEGLGIDDNGRLGVTMTIEVDDALSSTSTNPLENRVITNVLKDNEEVVSAALNDLKDKIEAASGDIMTTVETSLQSFSATVEEIEAGLANYAYQSSVDEINARLDSLPDFSSMMTMIESKADESDLEAVSGVVSTAVQVDEFNEAWADQLEVINAKADASELGKLSDKLGAIVNLSNIKESGNTYVYKEPDEVDYTRPLDHVVTMMHNLMKPVGGSSDELNYESLLWKLAKVLEGIDTAQELEKINRFLKNIPND